MSRSRELDGGGDGGDLSRPALAFDCRLTRLHACPSAVCAAGSNAGGGHASSPAPSIIGRLADALDVGPPAPSVAGSVPPSLTGSAAPSIMERLGAALDLGRPPSVAGSTRFSLPPPSVAGSVRPSIPGGRGSQAPSMMGESMNDFQIKDVKAALGLGDGSVTSEREQQPVGIPLGLPQQTRDLDLGMQMEAASLEPPAPDQASRPQSSYNSRPASVAHSAGLISAAPSDAGGIVAGPIYDSRAVYNSQHDDAVLSRTLQGSTLASIAHGLPRGLVGGDAPTLLEHLVPGAAATATATAAATNSASAAASRALPAPPAAKGTPAPPAAAEAESIQIRKPRKRQVEDPEAATVVISVEVMLVLIKNQPLTDKEIEAFEEQFKISVVDSFSDVNTFACSSTLERSATLERLPAIQGQDVRIDKEHLKQSLKRPMTMTERLRGLVSKKNDDGVERKIDLEFAVKANDDMADFVINRLTDSDIRIALNRTLFPHGMYMTQEEKNADARQKRIAEAEAAAAASAAHAPAAAGTVASDLVNVNGTSFGSAPGEAFLSMGESMGDHGQEVHASHNVCLVSGVHLGNEVEVAGEHGVGHGAAEQGAEGHGILKAQLQQPLQRPGRRQTHKASFFTKTHNAKQIFFDNVMCMKVTKVHSKVVFIDSVLIEITVEMMRRAKEGGSILDIFSSDLSDAAEPDQNKHLVSRERERREGDTERQRDGETDRETERRTEREREREREKDMYMYVCVCARAYIYAYMYMYMYAYVYPIS